MQKYGPVQRTGSASLFSRHWGGGWIEHSEPFFYFTFRTGLFLGALTTTATCNCFLGAFSGARICLGALAANGQVATMAQATIRADFNQTLDVHLNFAAQ